MSTSRTGADDALKRSFGFSEVAEGEKQARVDAVFDTVARRYDIMNDLMSGGLHRLWKDAMIAALAPPRRAGWRLIDVAGGTGDIAMRAVRASRGAAHVDVVDINPSMLAVGRERAAEAGLDGNLDFVEANAEALPFEAGTFDAYTIAFGIRNVPDIETALSEAYRVLKPGGRFLCLEFSEVDLPALDRLYEAWSFSAIPRLGKWIAGDEEPYRYLVESIRKFPRQRDFAAMIEKAGFARVHWRNYTGGVAALHSAWKI